MPTGHFIRTKSHCKHISESKKGKNMTHGENCKNSYLYRLWVSIKSRCYNSKRDNFIYYGGRGITVYEDWIHDYVAFRDYILKELGHRPSKKHSLNRMDNDGNYEPGNLEWSTQSQQNKNRRPFEYHNQYTK